MSRPLLIAILCTLASACGPGENDPGPGGVTVGEAKALDEAAAMLDARRSPVDGTATVPAPLPPPASATPAPPSPAPVSAN